MMRPIDADAAIKDAELNYGGVYDTVLIKHFLDRQPTINVDVWGENGCDSCNNKYCITCVYCTVDELHEPCKNCDSNHRNYKPTNYCSECGKRLLERGDKNE